MDFLEKFEEVHEQQLAELDDARSKLSVEVVSREMAFLNKKRKRKNTWGDGGATGSLRSFVQWNSQQMIARVQRRSRTHS
jgi:hypothetical protein